MFGVGGVCGSAWFSVLLPTSFHSLHINILELFAVYVAVIAWGRSWENKRICLFSDNQCVVQVATLGSCKDPHMMCILRTMFFFTALRNIRLLLRHIPGISNINADYLSRLQVQRFLRASPLADPEQTFIPAEIWRVFDDCDGPT